MRSIGDIFTPLLWAEFAVEKYDLFKMWLNGASVFDPAMGEGNLLEALINYGLKKGYTIEELPTYNLFGNEIHAPYFFNAIKKFRQKFNLLMDNNFTNADFFDLNPQEFDIVFANPPWMHYHDLPDTLKNKLKSFFLQYELATSYGKLLLGNSRIDLAALFIQRSISKFLKKGGFAVFFSPLSIFLNDGAHKAFRKFSIHNTSFRIVSIYDFNKTHIFDKIQTRYCLFGCLRDSQTTFPVPYFISKENSWKQCFASPILEPTDSFCIHTIEQDKANLTTPKLSLLKSQIPRQGINTCGANDIFIFDEYTDIDEVSCLLSNQHNKNCLLPKKYVFPLITSHNFKNGLQHVFKWVLLPYSHDGKPLSLENIELNHYLKQYLYKHSQRLKSRKGILINSYIRKGIWWALLGVGKYSFMPYKVIWEAYGRNKFTPIIIPGNWQANQSLQAFIPVETLQQAERILDFLNDNRIQKYLASMLMTGTMNWAQPGKIKKLFIIEQ